MRELYAITVEYGHQVEHLLERLGATGPARGAGERLTQVEHRLSPEAVQSVRDFLRLRNRVIHSKPAWMPLPTREQIEQAGRRAVGALEQALLERKVGSPPGPAHSPPRRMAATAPDVPGPVYRLLPRGEEYELWVGPAGVWVVAAEAQKRKELRQAVEGRLWARFPRLRVRAVRSKGGLERKARYGRRVLPAGEVKEAVRLLLQPPPAPPPLQPSGPPRPEHLMRRVVLEDIPAVFYVGPVGVLVVAEHARIAEAEAKRVLEDSAGRLPVLPVVRAPQLREAQGRVEGVLALRDEAAIKAYLGGRQVLDADEVDQVAGWLYKRHSPPPAISPKEGRYRLKGEEVVGGREKAPPAYRVEQVPPSRPPVRLRGLLRLAFLPQLALLPTLIEGWAALAVLGVLLVRLWASFGPDALCVKSRILLLVGGLELLLAGWMVYSAREAWTVAFSLVLLGLPGAASWLRVYWLGKTKAREELEWEATRVRI